MSRVNRNVQVFCVDGKPWNAAIYFATHVEETVQLWGDEDRGFSYER